MARQYTVKANLGDKSEAQDVNSQDPYWLFLVFSYDIIDSFNRNLITQAPKDGLRFVSSDSDFSHAGDTSPILFDSEIHSWSTQHDKDNHVDSLSLNLYNVDDNLSMLSCMNGGDWCMFWSFQDRSTYESIKARLVNDYNCSPWSLGASTNIAANDITANDFKNTSSKNGPKGVTYWGSGLKFIGRLTAPRHHESRAPDGAIHLGYNVQAFGFQELDSYIYFDNALAFKNPNVIVYMQNIGLPTQNFLRTDGSVNTNSAIPGLIRIFLGIGPGALSKDIGNTPGRTATGGPGASDTPNVIYSVPDTLTKILFPSDTTKREYYSDVLQMIVGNQSFGNGQISPLEQPWELFTPDGSRKGTVLDTGDTLKDYVAPWNLDFKNKTVWDIVTSLLNAPINECYTALRPDANGNLLPTFVLRRNPYSSDTYQSSASALKATAFSQYPQWIIPSQLIVECDIGKTDAARTNYVHVTPTIMPSKNPLTNIELARFQNAPVVNKVDIARHGLRMYECQVTGFVNPQTQTSNDSKANEYTNFIADIVMDAHLRYSGSLTCVGIQAPISVGDNIVVNNILFHIESVIHEGGVGPNGAKHFMTTLHISHGIPLNLVLTDIDQAQQQQNARAQTRASPGPPTPEQVQDFRSVIQAPEDLKPPDDDAITKSRNDRSDLSVGLISRSVGDDDSWLLK
jgi:hypothetical protein